jgi:hypothetical protein
VTRIETPSFFPLLCYLEFVFDAEEAGLLKVVPLSSSYLVTSMLQPFLLQGAGRGEGKARGPVSGGHTNET